MSSADNAIDSFILVSYFSNRFSDLQVMPPLAIKKSPRAQSDSEYLHYKNVIQGRYFGVAPVSRSCQGRDEVRNGDMSARRR
jgi:hypothetical protein